MNFFDFLSANAKTLNFKEGDHIFHQGDADASIYFVKTGFLKAYYTSADGNENIKSFINQGSQIGSLRACFASEKCSFSLVCLEDCEVLQVEFSAVYEASKSDPELGAAMVDFLLGFSLKKEIREFELLCLSAEQRYARLLNENPELVDKVTQNEIARYLGVTPVGLSRIKKRLEDTTDL